VSTDKRFYEQLNTFKIADNPASAVQQVSNPVHLQSSNKEVLDAIIQVNRAGMRDGSPMPGTGVVTNVQIAADTTGHVTIYTPNAGEVFLVSTISVAPTAAGNINLSLSLEDSTSGAKAVIDASTGTVSTSTIIDILNGPLYISAECFLQAYIGTNTNGVTVNIGMHRVR